MRQPAGSASTDLMQSGEKLALRKMDQVGDEVALAWSDGGECFFGLEQLRRACPCAVCQGEADVLGMVDRPVVEYGPESFVLRRMQVIGGYALQPTWGDGHGTGLYSFSYLRRMSGLNVLSYGGGEGAASERL
jgi:DUF971 family protein